MSTQYSYARTRRDIMLTHAHEPPSRLRCRASLRVQEELLRELYDGVRAFDPAQPWIKDSSGRHRNLASLFDWPPSAIETHEDDSNSNDGDEAAAPPPPRAQFEAMSFSSHPHLSAASPDSATPFSLAVAVSPENADATAVQPAAAAAVSSSATASRDRRSLAASEPLSVAPTASPLESTGATGSNRHASSSTTALLGNSLQSTQRASPTQQLQQQQPLPPFQQHQRRGHPVCARNGCRRTVDLNPRTNEPRAYCSIRCMRLDRRQALFEFRALHEASTPPSRGGSRPLASGAGGDAHASDAAGPSPGSGSADTPASLSESELYLDNHIELLRAIEMSKLDYFRQTGQLPPEEISNSMPTSSAQSAHCIYI